MCSDLTFLGIIGPLDFIQGPECCCNTFPPPAP